MRAAILERVEIKLITEVQYIIASPFLWRFPPKTRKEVRTAVDIIKRDDAKLSEPIRSK